MSALKTIFIIGTRNMKQFSIFKRKGFTLVETLVAVAVFSILVAIGVGGFARALQTQRQVAALIASESNASIAIEQMAREIRTGYAFCNDPNNNGNPNTVCQNYCTPLGSGWGSGAWKCSALDFYNSDGTNVDYKMVNGLLERSTGGDVASAYVPITGNTVALQGLSFILFGNIEGDRWTPRITISMQVAPNTSDPAIANTPLNLQTSVSARTIDCGQATGC